METMKKALCLAVALLLSAGLLRAQEAANVQEAVATIKQSLEAMRGSYTADVTISGLDEEAGIKELPVVSYKQRVFADGNADFEASMERVPLPEEVPERLGDVPLKFVSTSEAMALQLDDTAVMREGRDPKMEADLAKVMTTALNEIPMPSDEELEAMDLRQEPEIIDGVACQTLTWVPEDYDPDNPRSVAMHCCSFSVEDHVLRAYVALDKDGKALFSLKFSNVDTNPSFGPEDFCIAPDVKVIKVDNDEDFGKQVQTLFMAKFIKAAITPKGKRRRTAGGSAPPPAKAAPYRWNGDKGGVSLVNKGGAPFFYDLSATGVPTVPPSDPVADGILVSREYHDPATGNFLMPDSTGTLRLALGDTVTVVLTVTPLAEGLDQIAIADLLPAGLEIDNPVVMRESNAVPGWLSAIRKNTVASGWVRSTDIRDDRLLLFTGRLENSQFTYVYTARAVTPGNYVLPAVTAEAMYDPRIRSRTAPARLEVSSK